MCLIIDPAIDFMFVGTYHKTRRKKLQYYYFFFVCVGPKTLTI